MKVYLAFPLLILLKTNVGLTQDLEVTRAEFEEIEQISQELLRKCPPSDCIIIGMGRSPTPIITHLRMSGNATAFNLPLPGGFRMHPHPLSDNFRLMNSPCHDLTNALKTRKTYLNVTVLNLKL